MIISSLKSLLYYYSYIYLFKCQLFLQSAMLDPLFKWWIVIGCGAADVCKCASTVGPPSNPVVWARE